MRYLNSAQAARLDQLIDEIEQRETIMAMLERYAIESNPYPLDWAETIEAGLTR